MMICQFQTSIEDWTKTPWKEINVEQMDMELRRFAKVQEASQNKYIYNFCFFFFLIQMCNVECFCCVS